MDGFIQMVIKVLLLDILPPLADWMRANGGLGYLAAYFRAVFRHYIIDVCDRRTLGIPNLRWQCIGGVVWSSPSGGRVTLQDTKDVPRWLNNAIQKVADVKRANGQLPLFDLKTKDRYNLYWIVSTIEGGHPVLAYYRRPRLLIW